MAALWQTPEALLQRLYKTWRGSRNTSGDRTTVKEKNASSISFWYSCRNDNLLCQTWVTLLLCQDLILMYLCTAYVSYCWHWKVTALDDAYMGVKISTNLSITSNVPSDTMKYFFSPSPFHPPPCPHQEVQQAEKYSLHIMITKSSWPKVSYVGLGKSAMNRVVSQS